MNNEHLVDYLNDEYEHTSFGYRLLEIELEHLYGCDVDVDTTDDNWRYEGRI